MSSNVCFSQILGLAIYNSVILDVHFPMVVYRKLMGVPPTLDDLKGLQPTLGRGLQQLLDFDGDVEEVCCLLASSPCPCPRRRCLVFV